MPKGKRERSALRKARELFPRNISETEESDSSVESNHDLAHIPIQEPPALENLVIEVTMEQVAEQLAQMAANLENIAQQQQQQQQQINAIGAFQAGPANPAPPILPPQVAVNPNFFAIPDIIKHGISKFDGNKKQLNAWLTNVETTLDILRPHYSDAQNMMFLQTIINGKIEGKAKDKLCTNGNPTTFEQVKAILLHHLGDHQDLTYYKCQLWQQAKTPNASIYNHYNNIRETTQIIKNLAQQDPDYRESWRTTNKWIEEDALAAFLTGLSKEMFGNTIANKPANIEEAYAFVCKFKNIENLTNKMSKPENKHKYNHNHNHNHNNNNNNNNNNNTNNSQPKVEKQNTEPMDVGSTRSRLTLNRNQFNNNEIPNENTSDSEEEEVDLNFCWATENQTKT